MRPRNARPEPLGWLECARWTGRPPDELPPGIVECARRQLAHGPYGRAEGDHGPVHASEDLLVRLVAMADDADRTTS